MFLDLFDFGKVSRESCQQGDYVRVSSRVDRDMYNWCSECGRRQLKGRPWCLMGCGPMPPCTNHQLRIMEHTISTIDQSSRIQWKQYSGGTKSLNGLIKRKLDNIVTRARKSGWDVNDFSSIAHMVSGVLSISRKCCVEEVSVLSLRYYPRLLAPRAALEIVVRKERLSTNRN